MWRGNLRKNKYNIYFGIYTFFLSFLVHCVSTNQATAASLYFSFYYLQYLPAF